MSNSRQQPDEEKIHTFTKALDALFAAIEEGNLDKVKTVLSTEKMPINVINEANEKHKVFGDALTAFQYACYKAKADIVEYLLEHGASLEKSKKNESTPLHYLAMSGVNEEEVERTLFILLKNNFDINTKDDHGNSTLLLACKFSPKLAVEILKHPDVDINDVNIRKENCLHRAAISGDINLISMFIEKGFNVNEIDAKGKTPLWHAKAKYRNSKMSNHDKENYKEISKLFERHGAITPAFHGEIIDLCKELEYFSFSDKISPGGLCFGLAAQAMIHLQDGESGLKRFNECNHIIGKYSPQELKQLINDAKSIQLDVHKQVIIDPNIVNLTDKEKKEIIKSIINFEFKQSKLSKNEKKYLVNYFSNIIKDRSFLYADWEENNEVIIRDKILEAIEKYKIEKQKKIETDNALKMKFGEEGPLYLEIDIMMQDVVIAHSVVRNTSLLKAKNQNLLVRQNMLTAFHLTSSKTAEKRGLISPKGSVFVLNEDKKKLRTFLEMLSLEKYGFKHPINFSLRSQNHAISLTYFPRTEGRPHPSWIFYDSNLGLLPIKDIDLLTDLVADALTEDNEFAVSVQLYSSKKDANLLKQCVDNLNAQPVWRHLHDININNAKVIHTLAIKTSATDIVKKAQKIQKRKPQFLVEVERVYGKDISKAYATLEDAIHKKQGYIPSEVGQKMINHIDRKDLESNRKKILAQSYSVKKHNRERLKIDMKNQLEEFFRDETNKYSNRSLYFLGDKVSTRKDEEIKFSHHGKLMYDELTKQDNKLESDTTESILSRTIAYAFDARFYPSTTSLFLRSDNINQLYDSMINLVDLDATIKKIEKHIKLLHDKVYGAFAGTTININGKELLVSGKVAELYQILLKIKDPGHTEKHYFLAQILDLAKKESSIFTSTKAFAVRHDDVWKFFATVNEMLVVKDNVKIQFKVEDKITPKSEISQKTKRGLGEGEKTVDPNRKTLK